MVLILGKGAEGPWGQGTQGQLEGNVLPAVLCEAATVSTVFQSESARAGATPLLSLIHISEPTRLILLSRMPSSA